MYGRGWWHPLKAGRTSSPVFWNNGPHVKNLIFVMLWPGFESPQARTRSLSPLTKLFHSSCPWLTLFLIFNFFCALWLSPSIPPRPPCNLSFVPAYPFCCVRFFAHIFHVVSATFHILNQILLLTSDQDLLMEKDSFWLHIIREVHSKVLSREAPYGIEDRAARLHSRTACIKDVIEHFLVTYILHALISLQIQLLSLNSQDSLMV